jgi:hypothetical protein
MTDILNGADTGPLAGWSIVCVQGHTLIGKHAFYDINQRTIARIDPGFALTCVMQMVQPDPRQAPQLMTMRQVMPFLTFPSIREINVPLDAIVIPIETLSRKERVELARSVDSCEQLIMAMRAQESGITVAPAGAKLPPMVKR